MRETMLHFDEAPTGEERERLRADLEGEGVVFEAVNRSVKPHLLFLAYDEERTTPVDLVRISTANGFGVRVVDL